MLGFMSYCDIIKIILPLNRQVSMEVEGLRQLPGFVVA